VTAPSAPTSGGDARAIPDISVAVVSWNTRDLLFCCLQSLEGHVRSGTAEVCVVDNASRDGSAEMVADAFPWVDLVASRENLGFGAAINLAAGRARAQWLGLANADIALEPDALTAMLRAGGRDARAGAIAPRLILPDGSTQHSVFAFPTVPHALLHNLGLLRRSRRLGDHFVALGAWDDTRARRVPWAVGAFLLVRRDAWEAIGGFDDRQWMYAEDLDIGWRLRRAGWATRYEPSALVHHQNSAATSQVWQDGDRTERWQRSTYAWMLRRRGCARTRATAAINVAGSATRLALLTPAARLNPARWSQPRDAARWWMRVHASGLAPTRSLRAHR
jgi:GT2 family glycosyltransferase